MRISDWSSDVCSSDLHFERVLPAHLGKASGAGTSRRVAFVDAVHILVEPHAFGAELAGEEHRREIGAAAAEQATLAVLARADEARHDDEAGRGELGLGMKDRKSTRLNSSHSCAYRM